MNALDLLVVQEIFMSETAKHADVVLPGTTFLEKDGTFTNTERRVQRVNKASRTSSRNKTRWSHSHRNDAKNLAMIKNYMMLTKSWPKLLM